MKAQGLNTLLVITCLVLLGGPAGAGTPGTEKWFFPAGTMYYSSPAIGADGTIYIGSADGKVHAVNPDGNPKWAFTANSAVGTGPAIGADGIIYAVSSIPACVYAIYPGDGTEKWACLIIGMNLGSSPAIGFDGTVYVGVGGGRPPGSEPYMAIPRGWPHLPGPCSTTTCAIQEARGAEFWAGSFPPSVCCWGIKTRWARPTLHRKWSSTAR